jgi:hypothetical protein
MSEEFSNEIRQVYKTLDNFLNKYCKSRILQKFFSESLESLFYAMIIKNFFSNLTQVNINEYSLPKGQINKIKLDFKKLISNVKKGSTLSQLGCLISLNDYNDFKNEIRTRYNDFYIIITFIENKINYKAIKGNVEKYTKKLNKAGRPSKDMHLILVTRILEKYIEKKAKLPSGSFIAKIVENVTVSSVNEISKDLVSSLYKDLSKMINYEEKCRKKDEKEIYKIWKTPIDLFEGLIKISSEAAEQHYTTIEQTTDDNNKFTHEALIKLHGRAIHISNEILVLIKAGYADGAMARWRSLHELSVVALFLIDNNDNISKRYLDHVYVKNYKESVDYRKYYRKLNYAALGRKAIFDINKDYKRVKNLYGKDFNDDYGWIPKSILKNRNFRSLENHVKLDILRPSYRMASNAVHSGAKGFWRLGLSEDLQESLLLTGPSVYGLADPLQNSVMSLLHITLSVLNLSPDFNSVLNMKVMSGWSIEIPTLVVQIQDSIEMTED